MHPLLMDFGLCCLILCHLVNLPGIWTFLVFEPSLSTILQGIWRYPMQCGRYVVSEICHSVQYDPIWSNMIVETYVNTCSFVQLRLLHRTSDRFSVKFDSKKISSDCRVRALRGESPMMELSLHHFRPHTIYEGHLWSLIHSDKYNERIARDLG